MKTLLESVTEQIENMSGRELVELNNDYCRAAGFSDDVIYENDDDFFNTYFEGNPTEAVRACHYGEYNYNDPYVKYNGYGNLDSFASIGTDDLVDTVEVIAEYAIDNQREFSMLDFTEEEEEENEE
ncbi:hypothetical protein [Sphingobacterium mizutaii]|uniref:hypothetical protein n=1 Tax=Sphingobacterium mizutaii TaxID=1010 RepID=UPI00289FAFBC|nr:hypothetical protein [Sphingobacterium mizutaii]